jgi:hypothetical protein
MRVLDMELEIPVPPRIDDPSKPDWSICQRAWWDVISAVYERTDSPMRIALEMRVMGGSQVTMAPQYGNALGTCSIEVLTPVNVDAAEWADFMQQVLDRWTSYTAPDGSPLNVRPHWAKQWQHLRYRGLDAVSYLRDVAYAGRIGEFNAGLAAAAEAGGTTLDECWARFGNPLLAQILRPAP